MYGGFFIGSLFKYNLFVLFVGVILSIIFFYFSKFVNFQFFKKNISYSTFSKKLVLFTLIISFFLHCFNFWLFIKYSNNASNSYLFNFNIFFQPDFFFLKIVNFSILNYKFSLEFFGYVFVLLAYMVGVISFLCLDSQFYWKNMKFIFICNFLVLIIYFFVTCSDFLLFFIFYESLLIPSFLFVYYTSQYRRGVQASLYFLIWTQVGSFLVLCALAYMTIITGSTSFIFSKFFVFTDSEIWFIYFLLFMGFGFKIPVWPFHYWLTKTHVEAPAGFSIFLSGFLVKSAVYGFYRLSNLLGGNLDTSFFSVLPIMGVLDSSFKMWGQIDLKKLVAYCTIQEMSLLYLVFIWGDTMCFIGGVLLCITHSLLSSVMFFLVDCIQRRYKTRLVTELSGIIHTTPNLGISLICMVVLYSGIPGSLKFSSEVYIYTGLFENSPLSSVILLFGSNFFGLIGFSKCWFNVIFGLNLKNCTNPQIDLTSKEILIIFVCIFFSFLFNFFLNLM